MVLISKEKIVLDIGGGDRFQKWLEPYKDLFKNCDYKTMDYDARTGADVVGDIHAISLKDESVDAIICSSVLEHVKDPIRAVLELKRVLKRGGKIFVYVPSIYPYHARKGSYPDYWRFFDDSLLFMFEGFSKVELIKAGGYFKTLSFFFPMQHKLKFILHPVSTVLDKIFGTAKRTTTYGYYLYAIK
jgi:ubiquinone/menaquinone biosynthesis C-methylase UbiE